MLEIEKKIATVDTLPDMQKIAEKPLFFDIETTGLSAKSASIYLIGVVYQVQKDWYYRQWFAERLSEEAAILHSFFEFAKDYHTLIHFNGTTFDIPFIKACAKQYHIPYPLSDMESLDLLLRLKPYKTLLQLERMNQKTLEQRLGLYREDRYGGGELISVYRSYLENPSEEAKHLLLLHNAEDLSGMLTVASALNYELLLKSTFSLTNQTRKENRLLLNLTCNEPIYVPLPAHMETEDGFSLTMQDNTLILFLPFAENTLKLFFSDWKNYYYLPNEDKAIHKSVGEYVDPAFRVKATAANCYQTFPGTFIRQFKPFLQPVFYEEYNGKRAYLRLESSSLDDKEILHLYLHSLLTHYVNKKLFV